MNEKEKDQLVELFEQLEGQFDLAEPTAGHQERFLEKLGAAQNGVAYTKPKGSSWWRPVMIAASVALVMGFFVGKSLFSSTPTLQDISPEMAETQVYFTSLIEVELTKVRSEAGPDTQLIVDDAMEQLEKMEADYLQLREELIANGDDRRLIHAMINNFQTRIDLLQNVLIQIDEVKLLKNQNHEDII